MSTLNIGRDKIGRKIDFEWELKETKNGLEFSMSAMYWNKPHTDIIRGGQCCDDVLKEIHTWATSRKKALRMVEIWSQYHLNGMNAGCAHQRAEHWENRRIPRDEVGDKYAGGDERGIYATQVYPLEACEGHFEKGAWVNASPFVSRDHCHKDGLLTKKCPVCGYQYGSAWIHEDIPEEIIKEIRSW